ncbi:MAG: substrate-binding periplasmic protein [Vampirovibrionia bacterium]
MYSKFYSVLILTVLVFSVFLLGGCLSPKDPNLLKVGISGQMQPYSFYDDNTNELVGFDVDIANEISKRLNKKIELQVYSYNRLIPAILSNQIDFGMGSMNIVEERKQVVNFTIPYNVSRGKFVVSKDLKDINTIEDIKNSTQLVGVRNGTVYPRTLINNYSFNPDKLKIFPSQRDLKIAILAGTVKVAISDFGAMHYLNKNNDIDLKFVGLVTEADAGITVNKNNTALLDELNTALQSMIEDGTYEKIAIKWFEANPLVKTKSEI